MSKSKVRQILAELRIHAPFTLIGAVTGILFMLLFRNIGQAGAQKLFAVFHPLHVILSAMVTASLFKLHRKARSFFLILLIGYFGSIGIATLSDSILPFFGETILGAAIPTHAGMHEHEHQHAEQSEAADEHAAHEHPDHEDHAHTEDMHEESLHTEHEHDHESESVLSAHEDHEHGHGPELHLGFIEEWWLVTPAAILGVLIAYFRPSTRYPHAAHVLFSTWASSSHMLMNTQADFSIVLLFGMLIVLFLAVWLPCCVSDIVFPMLFVKGGHIPHHRCVFCGPVEEDGPHEETH